MWYWIIIFLISTAVLVKSADFLTSRAEKFGKLVGMPQFVVGVIIVSFGTSLPELASSIIAVTSGASDIVIGNVLGSNVVNILLGLGVASIVAKPVLKMTHDLFTADMPILVVATIIVLFTAFDGDITLLESVLYLVGFGGYLYYMRALNKDGNNKKSTSGSAGQELLLIGIAATVLFFSAKYLIDSVISISEITGFGTSVLAASAVALGTSLPEIAVTAAAARRGNSGIVMGNIIGSSIFNIFAIVGIAGLFGTLIVTPITSGFILPFTVVTTLLYWLVLHDKKIVKAEGSFMILLYFVFLGKVLGLL